MISIIELLYGSFNLHNNVCKPSENDLMEPQMWLIVKSLVEMVFLLLVVIYKWSSSMIIIIFAWMFAIIYMCLMFIGVGIAWDTCLNNFNIEGSFFVAFGIIASGVISYNNILVIDDVDGYTQPIMYYSHLGIPLYNDGDRV